jgi:signal transduction histidine kinase
LNAFNCGMNHRLSIVGRLGVGVACDLEHDMRVVEDALRVLEWHGVRGEPKIAHDEALDAVRHARRLTQCLLAYVRGDSLLTARVELAPVVRRVLDGFAGVFGRGVRLVVEIAQDLPPVHANAADLELLVANALLYASDHVPGDGYIVVSLAREAPNKIVLELANSGAVEPTNETSDAIADDPCLGVAITIAERHGAHLQRLPRAGGGSRCVITFPIDAQR